MDSSARSIAVRPPRSPALRYAASTCGTDRAPITASRAIAASRLTSSLPDSASTSARISTAPDALITMTE